MVKVQVNVYDLVEEQSWVGLYHSGVEILGTEYSFAGNSGVYECEPRRAPDGRFKCSHVIGDTTKSMSEVKSVVDRLRDKFHGDSYDLIEQNCNHFSNALCMRLLDKGIPSYINRAACVGKFCSCFVPPGMRRSTNSHADSAASQQTYNFVPFTGGGCRLTDRQSQTHTHTPTHTPLLTRVMGTKASENHTNTSTTCTPLTTNTHTHTHTHTIKC
eukprot:GHVR01138635.1.p1 GENE.GHVR01138635.1~~GHVR01138635.1.p1  ORF type:complete len:230 (-),score=68.75 GHVR01138635.1:262-906(-)